MEDIGSGLGYPTPVYTYPQFLTCSNHPWNHMASSTFVALFQ